MYEERKFKLDINWKSLLIKLGILLLIVFVICFIIFRPKKNKDFVSLSDNINAVKEAAIEYYKDNMTLKNIGDASKVTLEELENGEYVVVQKNSKDETCDNEKSYAYLTKVRDDEFVLKINMICGKYEESKIYNLTTKDLTVIASAEEKDEVEEDEEILVEKDEVTETPSIKEEIEEDKEIADNKDSNENKQEEDNIIAEVPSNKVLRYKHIKYGEWTEGNRVGNNIEYGSKDINYYEYCLDGNCITDREDNQNKYVGYTKTFSHKETVTMYRYVYVIWSNMCCIKGFINTGITEYQ